MKSTSKKPLKITEPIFFDVDDTLCLWRKLRPGEVYVEMTCPFYGTKESFVPHREHIEKLIEHKKNGETVVVWSQGGAEWAEAAVKALGLEEYVDLIMAKPAKYYDDLDSVYWMCNRTWIGEEPRLGSNPEKGLQE